MASQSAKPTAPASAQVSLADSKLAKPTFSVPVVADASSDDSAPIVDHSLGDEGQHHSNQGHVLLQYDQQGIKYKYFAQIPIWLHYFNLCIYW
jgi:hypothetical protein